ncbi:hypothetical protein GCM10027174_12970 [Salinifilum aidingensis]
MAEGNPLVEQVDPVVSEEDGIAVYDFANDAVSAAYRGDWCEAGINTGAAALDGAMAVADPFGTLLSSVFAWMMEHVSPLPEMLDALAGDPDAVQSNAKTWGNISRHLSDAAADMQQVVQSDTAGWSGAASDVYRKVGLGEAKLIEGAGTAADAVGAAVSGAGVAVHAVRTIVRDLIASAMSDLVQYLGRSAIAAGVTLGAATPLLVADGIRVVAKWANRVSEWLEKIVKSFRNLAQIVERVKPALSKVDEAMQPLKSGGGKLVSGANSVGKPLTNLSRTEEAVFHTVRDSASVGATYDDQEYTTDQEDAR